MTTQHGSNLTGAIEQNGGTTRIVYGQPAPEPGSLGAHRGEPHKVVGGTQRFDAQGNLTGESTFSRYQSHDGAVAAEQAAARGGSIAQSYDRANGGTVMLEGGMRTSVASALRQGLIRMEGGRPVDVGFRQPVGPATRIASEDESDTAFSQWLADKPTRDAAHKASMDELAAKHAAWDLNESAALPPAEHFMVDEWTAYEGDVAQLSQPAFDSTMSLGTLAAMNGTGLEAAATRLSRESGMSPARAAVMVQSVEGMFRDVVSRAVTADGIQAEDLPAFYSFCRDQRGLQTAIAELTGQRKTERFREFAREFSARQARHANVNG